MHTRKFEETAHKTLPLPPCMSLVHVRRKLSTARGKRHRAPAALNAAGRGIVHMHNKPQPAAGAAFEPESAKLAGSR